MHVPGIRLIWEAAANGSMSGYSEVGSTRGNVTPNLLRNAKVHLFGKQTFIFTVYPAKVQLFLSDGSKMDPAAENRCTFTFGVQGEAEFKQNRSTFAG
jgi:hypothetical protein